MSTEEAENVMPVEQQEDVVVVNTQPSDVDTNGVEAEVTSTTAALNTAADNLGDSIQSLKEKVEELARTIGVENAPNPGSDVVVGDVPGEGESIDGGNEVYGEMELVGGTFTTDRDVHYSLKSGLRDMFGEGISGAGEIHGSMESMALSKIGHAAEDTLSRVKGVEESLVGKLTNIQSLKNVMNTTIDKLVDVVKRTDSDGTGEANAKIIKEVHDKLNDEFNSQMKSLQTILNLKLKPTANDLMSLIKDNNKFQVLADRLGVDYNTPEASDRLALAYTNVSKLQMTAKKVEEALKTLEISLDKYKSLKSADELRKVLAEVLKNSTNGKSTQALSKVLAAIKTLKTSFGNHSKIVKELKGSMEFEGGDYNTGVGRVRSTTAKSTLKTRIKTYENTVKELFKNFIQQTGANFRDIKKSAEAVVEQLGNDITYDDDIRTFISIFEGFNSDLNNGKLFYALISLDQTMAGKELKTRFMDNLNNLIESLSALEKYSYLSDIKKQLQYIKENIDTYSDTVLSVRSSEENLKTGQSEFAWSDSLVDPSIPASVSNTIKETITKLKFYGNLSMLKENLNRVSKEYPEMQKGYDKLLGKSIGTKLTELQKEYTEAVDRLNDEERGRGYLLKTYNDGQKNASDKIPKGLIETIYKLQYEAKVGLYKTIEALDLYLMKFTEKVSNDVEALKELNTLLNQTELISAWADTSSLTNIDKLFEMIQPDADRVMAFNIASRTGVNQSLGATTFVSGENIRKVLEASKKSIESVAVLRNLIAMFSRIGDKFGDVSLSKEGYMTSGTMYNNLVKYIWVSAFTMGYGTAGGNGDDEIAGKKDKNGYEIEKGDKSYFFDMKLTTCNQPLDLLGKHQKQLVAKIDDILNNLNAAAKTAGDAYSKNQVSAAMRAYAGTVSATLSKAAAASHNDFKAVVDADLPNANDDDTARLYVTLKELKKELSNGDIFRTEDKYFVLALKAMSAKVLTVVGVSNLLSRPSKVTSMITNPVRSIIGAAEPEVIDGAVELYIRLPLLLEFYKNIFDNGNEKYKKNVYANDDTETIAFIPEIGSVWSGLIQCIFDDSKQISNGVYSLENMKRIILEVNKIYASYSGVEEAKLARTVVLDLISEINRRYGVLKRKEIDEFYQSKKKYSSSMNELSANANDYDILDAAEEDVDIGPSSEFTGSTINISSSKSKTVQNDIQLVKEFRDLINKELFSQKLADISQNSFSERVKMFKHEVKKASSRQSKVELIIKAIDESSNINAHNGDVILLYHELIRYPLSSLQKLYRHQMTSVIKLFSAIYQTLLIKEFEKSNKKDMLNAVYLLTSRIKMTDDFNANRSNLGRGGVASGDEKQLDNMKRNIRYNMYRLVDKHISEANPESLATFKTQEPARQARLAQAYADNALPENVLLQKGIAVMNAQVALESKSKEIINNYVTVEQNVDAAAVAQAKIDIAADELLIPNLKNAVQDALNGPEINVNGEIVRTVNNGGIPFVDRPRLIDICNNIINNEDADDILKLGLNGVNVQRAKRRAKSLIRALTESNKSYKPNKNDLQEVINPTGATEDDKKVNQFNAFTRIMKDAGNKLVGLGNNIMMKTKIAIVKKTGISADVIDRILPGRDIENYLRDEMKALGVSRAYGVFKRKAARLALRQKNIPSDTELTKLVSSIEGVTKETGESDIQANTKLTLEIIKWCKTAGGITNPNIDLIEETISKTINFMKNLNDDSDATSEIHLFAREFLKEVTHGKNLLTKESLLQFFMENFSSSGCSIKFISGDKYILDYSKMQTSVEDCLESCKYFLSKMRTQLNNSGLVSEAEKAINNLQDNYLNKMIYNQDTELTPIFDMLNFEQLNTTMSAIIQSSDLEIDSGNLYRLIISEDEPLSNFAPIFTIPAANGALQQDGIVADSSIFSNILNECMKTYMNKEKMWLRYNNLQNKSIYPNVIPSIYNSNCTLIREGSILFKFNNLIARYVETFFETSSKKIYANLFTEFSKTQNTSIFTGNGMADCFTGLINPVVNHYSFPKNDHVLSETLGFVIKVLLSRQQNKQLQTKLHAQSAISEVSPNMIEKYKTHLPVFISLFEKMLDNCNSYKKLLEMTSPSDVNGNDNDTDINLVRSKLLSDEDAEEINLKGSWVDGNAQIYSHLNNILSNIINSLRSLITDASVVLKETDYNPQFFEIKDKFIKNFFSNSSSLPVMPNSILSNKLITIGNSLPSDNMDDSVCKLIYGTNYVLNNKNVSSDLNNFLWIKEFIVNYNNSTQKVNNVSLDKLPKYLSSTNSIAKMLYEYNFLNKSVSKNALGIAVIDMTFARTVKKVSKTDDYLRIDTYYSSTNRTIGEILSITENSSIDNSKKIITDSLVQTAAKTVDRVKARLMNIIDMNISPINPHALLREIPLINVYNYAFTFDDIVSKDFQYNSSNLYLADGNNKEENIVNERTATAALLLDPYYCVNYVTKEDIAGVTTVHALNVETNGKTTTGVLKHALVNALPASSKYTVALGYPKYIKDVVSKCNDKEELKFNSKFTRNMLFVTNLHRYLLFKIKNEIERVDSKKVTSNHIISDKITSYADNSGKVVDNEFEYLTL